MVMEALEEATGEAAVGLGLGAEDHFQLNRHLSQLLLLAQVVEVQLVQLQPLQTPRPMPSEPTEEELKQVQSPPPHRLLGRLEEEEGA